MLATGLGACSQELDHCETRTNTFCDVFCIKKDAREAYSYFYPKSKNVI